jgi:hypothetical protein
MLVQRYRGHVGSVTNQGKSGDVRPATGGVGGKPAAGTSSPVANLFIIGTMKGGTEALHRFLDAHPAIAMSTVKETNHFAPSDLVASRWRSTLPYQDRATYHSLFPVGPDTRYAGEASTWYAFRPHAEGVAERLREYNPSARIIYLVRDPLGRLISNYFHSIRHLDRFVSFEHQVRHGHYVQVSDYAMQLAPYLAAFPESQIRIVVSERLRRSPEATLRALTDWLGLAPLAAESGTLGHHVTPDIVGTPNRLLRRTKLRGTPLWRLGSQHAPQPLRRLAQAIFFRNNMSTRSVTPAHVPADIRESLSTNIETFYKIVDGVIPEWRTNFPEAERAFSGQPARSPLLIGS